MAARKFLIGRLSRWSCIAICLVAVVTVAAWKTNLDLLEKWMPKKLTPAVHPSPFNDPTALIARIDGRLENQREQLEEHQNGVEHLTNLKASLETQLTELTSAAADRREELVRYAELVNADEAIVLTSGEFISEGDIRNRAESRRQEFVEFSEKLNHTSDLFKKIEQALTIENHATTECENATKELESLRSTLLMKLEMFNRLKSQHLGEQKGPTSMAELQKSVRQIEDVLDIRLEMLDQHAPIQIHETD